jgi:hypothetical protein
MAGILRPNQSGNIVKTSRMTFSHLADAFASTVGGSRLWGIPGRSRQQIDRPLRDQKRKLTAAMPRRPSRGPRRGCAGPEADLSFSSAAKVRRGISAFSVLRRFLSPGGQVVSVRNNRDSWRRPSSARPALFAGGLHTAG